MMTQQLKDKFIIMTKKHISLVNEYAAKLGKSYPNHDASKLDMLLNGYCYFYKPKEERTEEEQQALDLATLIHVRNSSHHPEYWTKTSIEGFTRDNFTPNGIIDATEMPEECLEEMVCDWCAKSEELKTNTATEWFNSVNGTRWLFTSEQQNLIMQLLDKLEN